MQNVLILEFLNACTPANMEDDSVVVIKWILYLQKGKKKRKKKESCSVLSDF